MCQIEKLKTKIFKENISNTQSKNSKILEKCPFPSTESIQIKFLKGECGIKFSKRNVQN